MVKIPLPILCPENPKKSLQIQAEIVRILDAFTELTARKKIPLIWRGARRAGWWGGGVEDVG